MKTTALALAGLLAFSTLAGAAQIPNVQEIVDHLKFMGYQVTVGEDQDKIEVTHPVHLNFLLRPFRGGLLISTYFIATEYGKANRAEFVEFANELNVEAAAARYYIDKDGDLAIEGYYPGDYDKSRFQVFLDAFNLTQGQLAERGETLRKLAQ